MCYEYALPDAKDLMRTDLTEEDVKPLKSKMADNLFHQVPVGIGGKSELK
jgi:RNA-splicing ligase RtcB